VKFVGLALYEKYKYTDTVTDEKLNPTHTPLKGASEVMKTRRQRGLMAKYQSPMGNVTLIL
jgi:hypothetical protein